VVDANAVLISELLKHVLGENTLFGLYHLVDQDRLPRLGCGKDFVRRFRLFAAPRNLGHHAKETSGALGGVEQAQFLGNYAIEGKLLQLCEGEVT
jgi:hypothetical protein